MEEHALYTRRGGDRLGDDGIASGSHGYLGEVDGDEGGGGVCGRDAVGVVDGAGAALQCDGNELCRAAGGSVGLGEHVDASAGCLPGSDAPEYLVAVVLVAASPEGVALGCGLDDVEGVAVLFVAEADDDEPALLVMEADGVGELVGADLVSAGPLEVALRIEPGEVEAPTVEGGWACGDGGEPAVGQEGESVPGGVGAEDAVGLLVAEAGVGFFPEDVAVGVHLDEEDVLGVASEEDEIAVGQGLYCGDGGEEAVGGVGACPEGGALGVGLVDVEGPELGYALCIEGAVEAGLDEVSVWQRSEGEGRAQGGVGGVELLVLGLCRVTERGNQQEHMGKVANQESGVAHTSCRQLDCGSKLTPICG